MRTATMPALRSMHNAQGLPEGAEVRALHAGTDIEAEIYGDDGAVLTQPLIVGKDGVPGRARCPVELIADWSGGSRRRALRRSRGRACPTEARPRGIAALSALSLLRQELPVIDPTPVSGIPALVALRRLHLQPPVADADRRRLALAAGAMTALARMMLGPPGPVPLPDIDALQILDGDGDTLLNVEQPLHGLDGALDEVTGLIPIDAAHFGVSDGEPYYSPGGANTGEEAVLSWDPQGQCFSIVIGGVA